MGGCWPDHAHRQACPLRLYADLGTPTLGAHLPGGDPVPRVRRRRHLRRPEQEAWPRLRRGPCSRSRLTCPSTSLLASWLICGRLPVARLFLSASSTIGRSCLPAHWTRTPSARSWCTRSDSGRVSRRRFPRLTDFTTNFKFVRLVKYDVI